MGGLTDPIDRYLTELEVALARRADGGGAGLDRDEVEAHLRDIQSDLVGRGVEPGVAAGRAVDRFGPVDALLPPPAPGWCSARSIAAGARVAADTLGLGLAAIGAGALLTVAAEVVLGGHLVVGSDGPAHMGASLLLRVVAGALGLLALEWRWSGRHPELGRTTRAGRAARALAVVLGLVGVALLVRGSMLLVDARGTGSGQWLAAGLPLLAVAVLGPGRRWRSEPARRSAEPA